EGRRRLSEQAEVIVPEASRLPPAVEHNRAVAEDRILHRMAKSVRWLDAQTPGELPHLGRVHRKFLSFAKLDAGHERQKTARRREEIHDLRIATGLVHGCLENDGGLLVDHTLWLSVVFCHEGGAASLSFRSCARRLRSDSPNRFGVTSNFGAVGFDDSVT